MTSEPQKSISPFGRIENVDVDGALRSVFADSEWKVKTGVGGILSAGSIIVLLYHFACIPLTFACWAVMTGYMLRVMRQKVSDPAGSLPQWNDWGDLFISGITWIAFQSLVWGLTVFTCASALMFCGISAASAHSNLETWLWSFCGTFLLAATFMNLAYLSSYLMVHFAIEESGAAGIAYLRIMKRLSRHPLHYYTGFLLAIGIQWAAVILPALSIAGIFFIPSSYVIGQIASAAILAHFWRTDVEAP